MLFLTFVGVGVSLAVEMNIPPVILEVLSIPTAVRDAIEWRRREVRGFIDRHRVGVTVAAVSAATVAALAGAAGAGAALAGAKEARHEASPVGASFAGVPSVGVPSMPSMFSAK